MEAAGKRKDRSVEELYNSSEMILQPEITPVLRGACQMQGPVHETDNDVQKNMAERRFGKRSMSRKGRTRAESGTCNVCSAPCSSCMHLNLGFMGSKSDEFSDETCRLTVASQHSVKEEDVLRSFKARACDSLPNTASEASNLVSVNSSHDSFSENAESKVTIRSSDISDASEDVEMLPKLSCSGNGADNKFMLVQKCVSDQRTFSNKSEGSKGVEAHDDNISCLTRADDVSLEVAYHNNEKMVSKNVSHSSVVVSGLDLDGSGKGLLSQKSDLSEVPSLQEAEAGGSSLKVQSPDYHPQSTTCPILGDSEVLLKMYPKSEADNNKDGGQPSHEAVKSSGEDKHDEKKSNEMVRLHDIPEPPSQAISGDDSDGSEMVEHDVKVCDICGDAGREDLLAICSRCSDGAEHTYCMREMLQQVPEGDWLCEECKFAEGTESQKQGSDVEEKRANKVNSSTQSSGKRHAENIEVASAVKRQAVESSTGSQKSSSPTRVPVLSWTTSSKSLDKGKIKSAHQTSFVNHSNNDILETARSPTTGSRPQTPRSTLLKSNSFNTLNSKLKEKLVDEVVPQKQKGAKEHASLDTKDRSARTIGKSMSFKSANIGRSNCGESKVKMLPSKFSHVQELKGTKQVKERTAFERKNLSKFDRSLVCSTTATSTISTPKVDQMLTPCGETVSLPSASNNRDSKVLQSEGKVCTLPKSASNLARNRVEIPVTSAGPLSTNGICSSAEHKSNQASPKDEPSSSSSWNVERPSSNLNTIPQDGLPRLLDSTIQGEKTREGLGGRSRPTFVSGSKGVPCQKCKEVGHAAEYCPIDSQLASSGEVSAARNSREDINKGNKLKAAIEAAMRKKPGFGKNRGLDQSDGFSISGLEFERASQGQLSFSNKLKNLNSIEGIQEGQATLWSSSDSYKQANTNNAKQLVVPFTDVVFPTGFGDLDPNVPSIMKPTMKDAPSNALAAMSLKDAPSNALAAVSFLSKISAIPEHEFIWQGGFEVDRSGKVLELCSGIQAHLSSSASPKVLEVVNKFPQRVILSEVPRLCAWPMQFHDGGAKEGHIALYFFAKDLESYEKNYKGLVDGMIKNDLALKGNLDGVELLIFSSNLLPENCQRWNMLFFLWGVFRGRRTNYSNSLKSSCSPGLNVVPKDKDISSDVFSHNQHSSKHIEKESSTYGNSSNNMGVASKTQGKRSATANGDRNKVSSVEQTSMGPETDSQGLDNRLDSKFLSRIAASSMQLCPEVSCTSPLEEHGLPVCGQEMGPKPCLQENRVNCGPNEAEKMQMNPSASLDRGDGSAVKVPPIFNNDVGVVVSVGEEDMPDSKDSDGELVKLERNSEGVDQHMVPEKSLERDLNSWQSTHQKRPHFYLAETTPQTSCGTNDKMPWNEMNSAFIDGESMSKKMKTGFSEIYGCSSSRDESSFTDGFTSEICEIGPSSLIEKRYDGSCDEKDIPSKLGTTERYFFPVGSHHAKDFQLGDNSRPLKELSSQDEDRVHDAIPNLELALGAERKLPNKGPLSFFVGMVDKSNNQDEPPDKITVKEEEDDVSASLSLSLSFPFPEKERTVKPVSKTEQLLPERHRVNTSLLLFGGLPDK